MQNIHVVVLLLTAFNLGNSSLRDALSESPIAFKQTKTKDEIVLKIVHQEEHPEYPGNNIENLEKINIYWNKYYDCLNMKLEHEREKPILVQIMEAQYTSLKCPYCQRPFQETANLEWRYKPLSSDVDDPDMLQTLDLAPQMQLSRKMTLKIYNAIRGYSGLYACYYGNNPISVYILEVVTEQRIIMLNEEPLHNDTVQLPDGTHLEVYYRWSKWTECSACNAVGKKYKYGICMARLEQTPYFVTKNIRPGYISGMRGMKKLRKYFKKSKKRQESIVTPQPATDDMKILRQIMNKFQTGIPCTSHIMPNLYGSLIRNLNKTPSTAIVEYCKVDCPESTLFEVIDHNGRVIEIANNSAGIYSSLQIVPKTPPEVERRTVTAEFGEDITIQCPGNMNTDTPVTWMIDNQMLIPELISNESNGRIIIDLLNRLHINRLRLKDSNVYSCWQRNTLAGTVTLNVDKKLKLSYDHHMMLISMLLVAVTFLYVGIKIVLRELKMRKR